jgi:Ran GTPase-activating protein (RanGAP) involved in mRNA processing and transport
MFGISCIEVRISRVSTGVEIRWATIQRICWQPESITLIHLYVVVDNWWFVGMQKLFSFPQLDNTLHSKLKHLDLSWCDITSKGIWYLAKWMKHTAPMCQLYRLNLVGNPIGKDGAQMLADMLRENHLLVQLNLTECEIPFSGILTIFSALKHNQTLEVLQLLEIQSGNDEDISNYIYYTAFIKFIPECHLKILKVDTYSWG